MRLNVETHVRSKLTHARRAYVRLEQTLRPGPRTAEAASWLKDMDEQTRRFTDTLGSWGKMFGILAAAVAVVLSPIVTILTRVDLTAVREKLPSTDALIAGSSGYIVAGFGYLMFYFAAFALLSFRGKRYILTSRDAYKVEGALFNLLPVYKRREYPIDLAVGFILSVSFTAYIGWLGYTRGSLWWIPAYAFYGIFAVSFAVLSVRAWTRRTDR